MYLTSTLSTTQTAREFRKQKLLGHLAFVRFIGNVTQALLQSFLSLARGSINRSCCNADHTDCSIYYFYYVKPEKVHVNKYNTQSVRSAVCMHGLSEHCTHRVFVCASKAVNYTFCPSLPGNKFSLASKLSRYNVIECVIIAEK